MRVFHASAHRLLFAGLITCAGPLKGDLAEYLARPDVSFAWHLTRKSEAAGATLHEIRLTSQTWQGIVWEHNLNIFVPTTAAGDAPTATQRSALLMIDGGSQSGLETRPKTDAIVYGSLLAQRVGAPVAVLRQVPNQPLLNGLKEDALIAETFRRFVQTGDESWPLLLPMTKSAVRAMDAVGEFSERELGGRIDRFLVTGASKRGWTTWLTAAVDARVVALAPMVIDVLNTKLQMEHQATVFGTWSEETRDYHALLRQAENDQIRRLWEIVDPFGFRDKLTQPKLIILGNNDPYWATDALNLYWDGLAGPKWIHYVPNAGHNLKQTTAGTTLPPLSAINTLGVFARHQLRGEAMPSLEWKHDDTAGHARLTVKSTKPPKSGRLWRANASAHDFRKATWVDQPLAIENMSASAEIELPVAGSTAFYAALEFESEALAYSLCTQLRILDAPAAAGAR